MEARILAQEFSKDASTQVGAQFFDPSDFTPITTGFNGMPRGVNEGIPERHIRPLKYSFYEHAERNAIYNLARPHLAGSVALTTGTPHMGCVRAIASVGTAELWMPEQSQDLPESQIALEMLTEAGVALRWYRPESLHGLPGVDARHFRKVTRFHSFASRMAVLKSKDPQAAYTVFVHPQDYTMLTQGYSGQPRGADDSAVSRYAAPLRDLWVEGASRNAIFNLMRRYLKGSSVGVTATTCVECARAIAGVGAKAVYYVEPTQDFVERWGPSITTALAMLDELGVSHAETSACEIPA